MRGAPQDRSPALSCQVTAMTVPDKSSPFQRTQRHATLPKHPKQWPSKSAVNTLQRQGRPDDQEQRFPPEPAKSATTVRSPGLHSQSIACRQKVSFTSDRSGLFWLKTDVVVSRCVKVPEFYQRLNSRAEEHGRGSINQCAFLIQAR